MRQAYCVELDKIITADEAWRMIFGGEGLETKNLSFKCPDEKCRANLLASNLRAVSSPSEVYFKVHLKDKHVPYCIYSNKKNISLEINSPEQAKDFLFITLGYLYKHFSDRLEQVEKKVET